MPEKSGKDSLDAVQLVIWIYMSNILSRACLSFRHLKTLKIRKIGPTFHFSSWLTVKDPTKAMSPF